MEKIISQDQMRMMLHISKRKAKFLLDNGIIPCINTGKKTRQYRVKLSDIESFIQNPYEFETGMFSSKYKYIPRENDAFKLDRGTVIEYYSELLSKENNIFTVSEVSEIIGYSSKAIYRWIEKGRLNTLFLMNKTYITKKELIEFVSSKDYLSIVQKSEKHNKQIAEIKARCSTVSE